MEVDRLSPAARSLPTRDISRARDALGAAVAAGDIGGVVAVHDTVAALEELLRRRGGALAQANDLAVIRLEAERAIGDVLRRTVRKGSRRDRLPRGISRTFAWRCRKLASIPDQQFREIIAAHRETDEITTTFVLRKAGLGGKRRPRHAILRLRGDITVRGILRVAPALAAVNPDIRESLLDARVIGFVIDTGE